MGIREIDPRADRNLGLQPFVRSIVRSPVLALICGVFGLMAQADAPDGGTPRDGGEMAHRFEPCGAERNRLERRKAWLAERYREQAAKGFPDPDKGIPNMLAVFCQANPTHEECTLGDPPSEFSPDELTWEAQQTFEDREPHVIGLKRALDRCLRRQR